MEEAAVLNMREWIGQTPCNPAGCLNKSASEVWKSAVQMNGVNLVGWVQHTRSENALWNLVCYPLLSFKHFNHLFQTHLTAPASSLSIFFSLLSFLLRPTYFSQTFSLASSDSSLSSLVFLQLKYLKLETKQAASQQGAFNSLMWFHMQHSWDLLQRYE